MPRRYWCILFALAGLALAGAQQPSEQANTSGAQQQKAGPPAPTPAPAPSAETPYRPYPDYNPDPCYNAESHDAADLCAQWRAALAAEKAAHEARRATNWAIIATVLSFLAVAGLITTIYQTHGALGEARRGNRIALLEGRRARREARENAEGAEAGLKEARKATAAARRSATASQEALFASRAWMTCEGPVDRMMEMATLEDKPLGIQWHIFLEWANTGKSPAIDVYSWSTANLRARTPDPIPDLAPPERKGHEVPMIVGIGGKIETSIITLTWEQVEEMARGKTEIILGGFVEYRDVYRPKVVHRSSALVYVRVNGFRDNAEGRKVPTYSFGSASKGNYLT